MQVVGRGGKGHGGGTGGRLRDGNGLMRMRLCMRWWHLCASLDRRSPFPGDGGQKEKGPGRRLMCLLLLAVVPVLECQSRGLWSVVCGSAGVCGPSVCGPEGDQGIP